jgi:hypothetical protein
LLLECGACVSGLAMINCALSFSHNTKHCSAFPAWCARLLDMQAEN